MWDKIHARLSVLSVLVFTQITSRTVEQSAINFTLSLFRLPHCLMRLLLLLLLALIEWTYRGAGKWDNIVTIKWEILTDISNNVTIINSNTWSNSTISWTIVKQTVKCVELYSLGATFCYFLKNEMFYFLFVNSSKLKMSVTGMQKELNEPLQQMVYVFCNSDQ